MHANAEAEIEINVESPHGADALALIRSLSAELGARYGDDGAGAFKPSDVDVAGAAFVVARLDGRPVGCGALRPLGPGVGEVKRMFVEPPMRGRGISRLILHKIETVAVEFGYRALRLETGLHQPEAIGLYETAGYRRVPRYGIYVDNPLSVCFEKQLPLPQPPLLQSGGGRRGRSDVGQAHGLTPMRQVKDLP